MPKYEFKKPRLRPEALPTMFAQSLYKTINPTIPEGNERKQLFTNSKQHTYGKPMTTEDETWSYTRPWDETINKPDDLESSLLAIPLACNLFEMLKNDATPIQIPLEWNKCVYTSKEPNFVMYFELLSKVSSAIITQEISPVFGKTVIVDCNCHIQCSYLGKNIPINQITCDNNYNCESEVTVEQLETIISDFDEKNVCNGVDLKQCNMMFKTQVTYVDQLNKWRHNNCHIILQEKKKVCTLCSSINQTFINNKNRIKSKPRKRICLKVTPSKTSKLQLLRTRKNIKYQRNTHLKKKIINLKSIIEDCQEKMKNLNEQTVLDKIPSKEHKLLIQEILAASKRKNSHGNRYSEDWIMLSLLLHIRSPSAYSFLRENKIMPLLSVRTVRNYLSTINTKCGFDDNFFELFKKKLESKNAIQKHGLLVLDEMSVRENLCVKSKSLTYSGLIDFGKEDQLCDGLPKANSLSDLANHGLVLLFQPLTDTYTQPISVFASRGPVKGDTLLKLLIKATILLEKAGALVHGFVSDSALTNRKIWSELGISGKLENSCSYIEHFNDSNRKFFAFSDTSHLIKNIRNRLYNKHELIVDPVEGPIKWNHFKILHDYDRSLGNSKLYLCPKITDNHLNLENSSLKMRVRLAVQVLSNSVAVGLKVLKNRKVPGLENCDATINFCIRMNVMFDALNRKMPFEGVHTESNDYKVRNEMFTQCYSKSVCVI